MRKFLQATICSSSLFFAMAAEAKTIEGHSDDKSAKITAYFSGKTLLGIHLYDNKCDGDGVTVFVNYKGSKINEVKKIDNYKGCKKDVWYDKDIKKVSNVTVCREKAPLKIHVDCNTYLP